jgi:hypothetical protein
MFIRTNVRNYSDAYRVIQAMDSQAPLNTSEWLGVSERHLTILTEGCCPG